MKQKEELAKLKEEIEQRAKTEYALIKQIIRLNKKIEEAKPRWIRKH